MRKTVLILGAGQLQIPAIEAAHEKGWRVIVADANAHACGVPLADQFLHIDLADTEALVSAALEQKNKGALHGVFTAGTDFSYTVAKIAFACGFAGHSCDAAHRATHKAAMRQALAQANVPIPRFCVVNQARFDAMCSSQCEAIRDTQRDAHCAVEYATHSDLFTGAECGADSDGPGPGSSENAQQDSVPFKIADADWSDLPPFPVVVKPANNMGARGVRYVNSISDLVPALKIALLNSHTREAIVEEYIDGPEFSIDALVDGDDIHLMGIADRHIQFLPYFVETGHTMPTAFSAEIVEEVVEVFKRGVHALGLTKGAAKGDIKYCRARKSGVVGEIAARLSGGFMSGWTYPYASGRDPTSLALDLALGLPLSAMHEEAGFVSAERALISIPGKVSRVSGARRARSQLGVKDIYLRVSEGSVVRFPSNNVEKCGNVISQAEHRSVAIAACEAAIAHIMVRLEAHNQETDAFLARAAAHSDIGSLFEWPPWAFTIDSDTCKKIAELPHGMPASVAPEDRPAALLACLPAAENPALKDWNYRTLAESASLALRFAIADYPPASALWECVSPRAFWSALVAGGAQAGLYVLDSAASGNL